MNTNIFTIRATTRQDLVFLASFSSGESYEPVENKENAGPFQSTQSRKGAKNSG